MRTRYLIGVIAVLLLVLAVWLVPLALAAAGGSAAPDASSSPAPSQGQASQCPYLQAHPGLDPHATGGGSGSDGAAYQTFYY